MCWRGMPVLRILAPELLSLAHNQYLLVARIGMFQYTGWYSLFGRIGTAHVGRRM